MAVIRQTNLLGSQRLDVPHVRSIESGVAGDFDLLAGRIIAGKKPLVVTGFLVITTGITRADQIQIQVADSVLIHHLASESGSMFHVPADRSNETLSSTNPRLQGTFVPSQVNYVGLDFVRSADATTSDLVQFLNSDTNIESPKNVPLARTVDYKIVVSTTAFDSTPGILPICKVTTNATNEITTIEDARNIAWRLGAGGTAPNRKASYIWPGGRKENTTTDKFVGGDKSLTSQREWMEAVMTRLWELGSGEYWYSPTADRNLRMVTGGVTFTSTGEYFDWNGTNLLWRGLKLLFENSTGYINEIKDQLTASTGLTNLLDGECLYVDIDRTQNKTGGSALQAIKAPMATLGTSVVPGSRVVVAWRSGAQVYTRDQGFPVGSSFKVAALNAHGTVKISATDVTTPGEIRTPLIDSALQAVIASGLSRGPTTNDYVHGSGNLTIGGQTRDHNIFITTTRAQDTVQIFGAQIHALNNNAPLEVVNTTNANLTTNPRNRVAQFKGFNLASAANETALSIESIGAIGMRLAAATPFTPSPSGADPIRTKIFLKTNGVASFGTRDQLCVMWHDGTVLIIAEGPAY